MVVCLPLRPCDELAACLGCDPAFTRECWDRLQHPPAIPPECGRSGCRKGNKKFRLLKQMRILESVNESVRLYEDAENCRVRHKRCASSSSAATLEKTRVSSGRVGFES